MDFTGKRIRKAIETWRDHLTEAQWDLVRILGIVVGALALGGIAYEIGHGPWRAWRTHLALSQARTFAAKHDYANMLLAVRRATQLAPDNVDTWLEAARDLELIGSPEALDARQQLTYFDPNDQKLRIALVDEALRFGRYDTARAALSELISDGANDVEVNRLTVALAVDQGHWAEAGEALAKRIALRPGDANARFTYAALRLWNPDPAIAAAGRAELERLLQIRETRIRAAIELISEASRRQDAERVQALLVSLTALFGPPGAVSPEGLTARARWNLLLAELENAASSGPPSDEALVARWLADQGRGREAAVWLGVLPSADQDAPVVAEVAAQLAAERDDLPDLERRLRAGAWGTWPHDALMLAIAARVEARRFGSDRARDTWKDAVAACGSSRAGLRALERLARAWRDPEALAAVRTVLGDGGRSPKPPN